jgi:hypothetical protein
MTAKFNADILGRLGDATLDEINAALAALRDDQAALRAQYEGKPATEDSVTAYGNLIEAARKLTAEKSGREALAAQQAAQFAEMDELTAPDPAPEPAPESATDPEPAPDPTDPATVDPAGEAAREDGNTDPAGGTDDGPGPTDTGESAVTASGRRPLGGVSNIPGHTATEVATGLPRVTMKATAAAGLDQFAPGASLDRRGLIEAMTAKGRAVSGNVNGYERYTVATLRTEYPEDRMLRRGVVAYENMDRVDKVVRNVRTRHALTNQEEQVQVGLTPDGDVITAAGICGPLETLYDITVVGDTDRPVRDALTRFGADRGGIQWRPAIDGVTQTGGIGVWTPADDAADPIVPKTCVEIDCPGVLDAEVDAVYQCLTFSNMSTRFDPEFMDSVIRAQDIAHARFAENRLLTQLTTASKAIYSARTMGASRDILYTLDRITAYYRNVHRLNRDIALRWIAPQWALNMIRADVTRQMVGDGLQSLAVTDQEILRWFGQRNINPTWHMDGINPADITVPDPDIVVPAQFYTLLAANSPVPDFPTAISSLLFAEGDWLYLDGGTLDLGVVRDSTLNGQNRFQTFSESFETTAFRGIESIHLVIPAQPTGESAATVDTTP